MTAKRFALVLVLALTASPAAAQAPVIQTPEDLAAINACKPLVEPCIVNIHLANYFSAGPGSWPGRVTVQGPRSFAGAELPDWFTGADHALHKMMVDPAHWTFTEHFRNGIYTATWTGGEQDGPFTPLVCHEAWPICTGAGRPQHGAVGEYVILYVNLRPTAYFTEDGIPYLLRVSHPATFNPRGSEIVFP